MNEVGKSKNCSKKREREKEKLLIHFHFQTEPTVLNCPPSWLPIVNNSDDVLAPLSISICVICGSIRLHFRYTNYMQIKYIIVNERLF